MDDPPTSTSDLIGQVLSGTYEVLRELGRGGMGVVYEARHARTGARVAVKVLRHKEAASESVQARFEREAMLGSRLGHRHIVQVTDFQRTEQGFPYLVMELLEGEDLRARLRRDGPVGMLKAASITRQVALALAAAREEGVVHRDLKPENIFLARRADGTEVAKVLDFGLSKVMLSVTMATRDGQVLGTPNFMSPEQARGRIQEIEPRSDIFALGLVLHNMLTGEVPFAAKSLPATLYKVVHEDLAPLSSFRGDLPPGLVALVKRATAKEKAGRFGSADELLTELTRSLGGRWQDVLMLEVSGSAPHREVSVPAASSDEAAPAVAPPLPRHHRQGQGGLPAPWAWPWWWRWSQWAAGWRSSTWLRNRNSIRFHPPIPRPRPPTLGPLPLRPRPRPCPTPAFQTCCRTQPVPDRLPRPASPAPSSRPPSASPPCTRAGW